MTTIPTDVAAGAPPQAARQAWVVVAERELRDLWLAGRGLPLLLAYTVLLSATTYLVAANTALNFLEQREAVALTLQVAVAVAGLLVLLVSADAVSGERERGTLESLLLTPVPRHALVIGKGVAALSVWLAAYLVTLPYLWYLGRGVRVIGVSTLSGFVVGGLLALFLAGYGLAVSILSQTNRLSLSVSLFALLALYAPTQMPTAVRNGWIGELLLRADPFTAGLRYLGRVIVTGSSPGQEAGWLIGPLVAAVGAIAAALILAPRLRLRSGDRS
jgi:ABC-2 type transport system permease protein